MKMHYILFVLAIVVGIVAVVCTYLFGILPRHEHYQALLEEEEQLRDRIGQLEKKFSRTQPAAVVNQWREQIQPWAQAVSTRISYFDALEDDERLDIVVPEEQKEFPKFWYQEERRRRLDALADETFGANLTMASSALAPHEPPAPGGAGWNPDADSVEEWLKSYERAASFVREMINANAIELARVEIWPSEAIMAVPEGTVHLERVGYEIIIAMDDFADYLGQIHSSDTYVSISALSITKEGSLSDADAPIRATFILDRTRFVPIESTSDNQDSAPTIRRRASGGGAAESLGRSIGTGVKVQYSEEELARIRAATADQNPSFIRGILRWFGI